MISILCSELLRYGTVLSCILSFGGVEPKGSGTKRSGMMGWMDR